ncbi:hypothetical protein ACFPTO_01220 [Paraburkholderia denitrificans]|uniref:Uncharacterized protein n=1 Tax=Paraburkholderia denitrificans TaxID=694025 RepID=A0ABW0J320_9BURK
MRLFDDGAVNYPRTSEGMWFLRQFERWGLMARRDNNGGDPHACVDGFAIKSTHA